MIARRTVSTADATYTVVDAERVVTGALVIVRLLDAGSGTPLATARVHTDRQFAHVHVSSSGHLAVIGRADLVLPHLATVDETVVVELERTGRRPQQLSLLVPMGSALPLELADLLVEAAPIGIAGTVTTAAHPYTPVADAVVRAILPAGGPPFALALRTPLARDHPATTTIRSRVLNPVTATSLAQPVTAGPTAVTVALASVAGCAPDRVLAVGPPSDIEHVVIHAVDAATSTVTLRSPLRRSRSTATVEVLALGASGANVNLDRPPLAADGLVLTATDLTNSDLVEVVDPDPLRIELRTTNAWTDGDGRFRLSGIRGLERLSLVPELSPQPPGPIVTVLLDSTFDPVRADLTL